MFPLQSNTSFGNLIQTKNFTLLTVVCFVLCWSLLYRSIRSTDVVYFDQQTCALQKQNHRFGCFTSFSITNEKRSKNRKRRKIRKKGSASIKVLLPNTVRHPKAGRLLRRIQYFLIFHEKTYTKTKYSFRYFQMKSRKIIFLTGVYQCLGVNCNNKTV